MGDVQNFAAMSVGLALMGVGLGVTGGLAPPTRYLSTLWLGGPEPTQVAAWWPIVTSRLAARRDRTGSESARSEPVTR